MTEAKTFPRYCLPGNPVLPVPVVGNLLYDELGQEAVARLNKAFEGREGIEDKTTYKPGQLLRSNTPRNLFYHCFLQERTDNIDVQSPTDMVRFSNVLMGRDTTDADTNAVAVFPNPGPNEELRKLILAYFGKRATKIPLLVTGLKPVKVDSEQDGFVLIRTDFSVMSEAPYLTKSQRVSYNQKTGDLVLAQNGEAGVQIYVPEDQSGLRGAYRNGGILDFGNGRLLDSDASGRVPVIQYPEDSAENLDVLVQSLDAERERQITEANARFIKAQKFMRTGNF